MVLGILIGEGGMGGENPVRSNYPVFAPLNKWYGKPPSLHLHYLTQKVLTWWSCHMQSASAKHGQDTKPDTKPDQATLWVRREGDELVRMSRGHCHVLHTAFIKPQQWHCKFLVLSEVLCRAGLLMWVVNTVYLPRSRAMPRILRGSEPVLRLTDCTPSCHLLSRLSMWPWLICFQKQNNTRTSYISLRRL